MKYYLSIMTDNWEYCYLCRNKATDRHHIMNGNHIMRMKSEDYGLQIPLCRECHDMIHNNVIRRKQLKQRAQRRFLEHWSIDEWYKAFHKNYL